MTDAPDDRTRHDAAEHPYGGVEPRYSPEELAELLGGIAATARGEGAYTLWVQQTGTDRTAYAIEIAIGLQ